MEQQPLLLRIILSPSIPSEYFTLHHLPLSTAVSSLPTSELLSQLQVLDTYRRSCNNLYARVRCLLFLYAVHRFYLPLRRDGGISRCLVEKKEYFICPKGYAALLDRRFEEAIDRFLEYVEVDPDSMSEYNDEQIVLPKRTRMISDLTFDPTRKTATLRSTKERSRRSNFSSELVHDEQQKQPQSKLRLLLPSEAASSSLATTYRSLAFQTLADQVKSSVRSHPGNEWMFGVSCVKEQTLKFHDGLICGENVLVERTPVRMDLSHSWYVLVLRYGEYLIMLVYHSNIPHWICCYHDCNNSC